MTRQSCNSSSSSAIYFTSGLPNLRIFCLFKKMTLQSCNSSRWERFFHLKNGEAATCYSSREKEKHENVSQLCKEFELSNSEQLVKKDVQQHPDLTQQYKVTDCPKQQNEILEEVDRASCLLANPSQRIEISVAITCEPNTQIQELNKRLEELQETNVTVEESILLNGKSSTQIQEPNRKHGEMQETNVRVEESTVENGKPNRQIEELNKKLGELEETNVKLVQEKEVQVKEFEAVQAELAKKNRELEEKIIALMKENEEQRNVIEILQETSEEKMFLEEENAALGRINMVLQEKLVHHEGRIADLERALDSLTTDLESCSQIADEKEAQLIGLQYQFSDLSKENMYLEELNSALVTELNKCSKVLEENVYLHHELRKLDISSLALSNDLECKDILLQQMTSEHNQLKSEYQTSRLPVLA